MTLLSGRLPVVLLPLLMLALHAGCTSLPPARMDLPPALAGATPHPVAGRQGWKVGQELRFADAHVYDVERGLTKGPDLRILVYDQSRRRQLYSFRLADSEGPAWTGDCEAFVRKQRLTVGVEIELRNASMLGARFASTRDPDVAWEMKLSEAGETALTGTLARDQLVLHVRGTNRLSGTPLPLDETTGYTIEHDGRIVAAAEVINDGAVWFANDLPADLRGPVTAALSALLLFEELRSVLPE